jgi:hypothetical protein
MLIKRARRPTRFPERKVRLVLSEWWEEKMSSSVRPRGGSKDIRRTGGTVFDILPAVSAAQVLAALDRVESLFGLAAAIHVIQRNGYASKKEFVNSLCRGLKTEFEQCAGQRTGFPNEVKHG